MESEHSNVGAIAGGATGAMIGAVAGPIGAALGAAIGGVAGSFAENADRGGSGASGRKPGRAGDARRTDERQRKGD